MELRCQSRIQGVVVENGTLEVKCSAKHCGAGGGRVVLHYFNLDTGECVKTARFQNPDELFKKGQVAS